MREATPRPRLALLGDPQLLGLARAAGLLPGAPTLALADRAAALAFLAEAQPGDTLIALCARLDTELLLWLNDRCAEAGLRWVPFLLDGGRGWLGPAVVPGRSADYRDLLARRLCVAESRAMFAALCVPPLSLGGESTLPRRELVWMLAVFFTEVGRWLDSAPCRMVGAELEADPLAQTVAAHALLPLPERALAGPLLSSAAHTEDLLVDERAGVVLRTRPVAHHPSVPERLATVQAHVACMAWHDPGWHSDPICGGSAFDDPAQARRAAIGEAVERYCAGTSRWAHPVFACYRELAGSGEHAIDPERLVLFSERLYRSPGCPVVPFTRDLPVYWVRGRSLTRGCPAWLPLSLVYTAWRPEDAPGQPLTHPTYLPGLAAGASLEQALVSGIEELVERDSTLVWWLNAPRLPALRLPPDLAALWQGRPVEQGQRAWLIALPNEFGIPVLAGVVEHIRERLLNIGFACRPDPRAAALKAWSEALVLQEGSRDLLDSGGAVYQAVADGWLPGGFKPWRQDRAYQDDYRADFRDVVHLILQQQFFLDPRAVERVRPWVDVPPGADLAELPRLPDRSLAAYRARIEVRGYEIFYAEITTPDIAHTGMAVARVIVPGLVPNFPAAFPPAGGGRIQRAAVALGWRATPPGEDDLNYLPMPHA